MVQFSNTVRASAQRQESSYDHGYKIGDINILAIDHMNLLIMSKLDTLFPTVGLTSGKID